MSDESRPRFPPDQRELFEREAEFDIETASPDGEAHRVTIWVALDAGDVFVRSWRGASARWYRELVAASGRGAIHVAGHRIPVRAVPAVDAESIERCSRALEHKYAGSRETPSMLRDEVLETTLRLEPA